MRKIAGFMTFFAVAATVLVSSICVAESDLDDPLQPVYFQKIRVGGFWKVQFDRLTEKWIPHCIEQMEAGGAGQELLNLVHTGAALKGNPPGNFTGCPWSDAYIYNTMEAICLALSVDPEGDESLRKAQEFLRAKMDEWIPIILAAQCEDGYIHSYHIVNQYPRYTNINSHEFYVQGYFLEMGVAHYRITGGKDRRLYDAAVRCADQLCATFGPPPKRVWIHGHAGMGYALCRLARLVDQVEGPGKGYKYIELAKFLFDTRHTVEEHRNEYRQSHRPVVEMTDAVGHAVRATYFYTAMADLAMMSPDTRYLAAVDRIWSNAIDRKHYITGGVGASHHGEAFSADFDLRNDGYCESCAGCGMTFWADRMNRIHRNAQPIDVQERTLYNNILGSIELSGENFYYQNPLRSRQARYPWHGCPCCVGNIPRALLGLKDQLYRVDGSRTELFVNHFVACEGTIADVAGTALRLGQKTDYPWSGKVEFTLNPEKPAAFILRIRIPDRSESDLYTVVPDDSQEFSVQVNGESVTVTTAAGYLSLRRTWQPGDRVELDLPMNVQRVYADPRVRADLGRVALIRGPLVYNVEEVDHDVDMSQLVLPKDAPLHAVWKPDLLDGIMAIEGEAKIETESRGKATKLFAVPNFVRMNRGGGSQVWLVEDPEKIVEVPAASAPVVKAIVREDLDKRTVDRVVIGDRKSEREHQFREARSGDGVFQRMRWRHAYDGWFSYEMEVDPQSSNAVLCTYWGSDIGTRRFGILVDDEPIGHQVLDRNKPDQFFDVEYAIPTERTQGKKRVTVKLQADKGAMAGGVFDLRIVRVDSTQE